VRRILFVCHGNACRSVMVEAIARDKFGTTVEVASVGLYPQQAGDSQMALETLSAYFNLDASNHVPRSITEVDGNTFDYVVAMDPKIAKQLPNLQDGKVIIWEIDDPWGDDAEEYLKCAKSINKEVSKIAFTLR